MIEEVKPMPEGKIYSNFKEWIHDFNDINRPHFTQELFDRDNYEIVECLKKVALSCQRDMYFTIKVEDFRLIENYEEIYKILYDKEQSKIDRNKNKKQENLFDYIDLKDSDIMLLQIDYYIAIKTGIGGSVVESDRFTVTIAVPRIVDKYYFRIKGNIYQAIYQIVDASTYNNTASSSKNQSITMKTMFMPIRVYRKSYKSEDANGNPYKFTIYNSRIFSKNVPLVMYFLAKFGLEGTFDYLGIRGMINISKLYFEPEHDDDYHFVAGEYHITVPKYIFDNDLVVQAVTMTIHERLMVDASNKQFSKLNIWDRAYWLLALAGKFTSVLTEEKGLCVLDSLEATYDILTKETLLLPDKDKADIYGVLRWILREFNALRLKDNVDLTTKKYRRGAYMAVPYATKLSRGIYLANDQKKITCQDIRRYIDVPPFFLLDYIVKDRLVTYRNNVNDNDGVTCLKYSYKGAQGIEKKPPDAYRRIQPSHMGKVDPDTSSASDPGMTGIICPMAKVKNGTFVSDETEPNNWEQNFNELIQEYRVLKGRRELIRFQKDVDLIGDLEADIAGQNIESKMAMVETAIGLCNDVEEAPDEIAFNVPLQLIRFMD